MTDDVATLSKAKPAMRQSVPPSGVSLRRSRDELPDSSIREFASVAYRLFAPGPRQPLDASYLVAHLQRREPR